MLIDELLEQLAGGECAELFAYAGMLNPAIAAVTPGATAMSFMA